MDKKYCPYCMNPVKEGEACKNCGLTEGVYTPRDHHLPLGTVLNHRYLVGRVLGEGGFGITYIGCDLNLEMKVAIKEYFPIDRVYRFAKTSLQVSNYAHAAEKFYSGKEKFLREARTMARLDKQQSIVSVKDFFDENNTAYIVMEYVEGITLKELVNQRGGRIPAGELLQMLEPLFSALTSIHELGLIHRDISPDNLMLENGKIKLLDFGSARESEALSETMTIALKQGYAPIEQYQHRGQGPWTDIYALSATIYYCLTGKTPQSAVDRLSEEELIPPGKLGVDLNANQEAALLRGMNVKAKDRFQSAEELYTALYLNVAFPPVSDEPISVPNQDGKQSFHLWKQRRNRMILAGSAVFLVAVICMVCSAVFFRDSKDPKETIAPGIGESGEETVETLFANAAVLEAYTEENIRKLMDDDAVSAIRIPKAASGALTEVESTGSITITKPVLVERDTYISFHDMVTVRGENACLWIEGEVCADCILQTVDGGKIVTDNLDYIWVNTLWLEREEDLLLLNGEYPSHGDLIIGGKNTLFRNAVSVSDEASLRQAVSEKQAVIICDDITIETELYLHAPLMIEEGVTVGMQGFGSITGTGNDFFLWNEGKIQGGTLRTFQSDSDMRIINCGEISDGELVMDGSTLVVNLGDITVCTVGTDDGQSSICNIGTLRFRDKTNRQCNTNLINYGSVVISYIQGALFSFVSGIDNYGEIRVEDGVVILQSYLNNMIDGRILICDNAILDNRGVIEISGGECNLQCEPKGTLMNEEGAVYYFDVTPAYIPEDGWSHLAYSVYPACEVTNIDELTDALRNPEVDEIYLTGEIRWNNAAALTLTKDVEIARGAELLMEEGSELVLDGCFLGNSGYLKVDGLTLTRGGSLRNYETLELYTLGSVIRLGNMQGEMEYNEIDCLINHGDILNGCRIELYDSALMIQRGFLEESVIQIKGHACFANMGEIQWVDGGSIEISGKGQFHNLLWQEWSQELTMCIAEGGVFRNFGGLVIQSGDISVEQGGLFESILGDITFGNDLSVFNYGHFTFCQEGDGSLLQGYFENHGILQIEGSSGFVIDAPYKAVNPACLSNQGEVRIRDSDGYVRGDNGEFIGNAAVYGKE